jgi:hypothetical protein
MATIPPNVIGLIFAKRIEVDVQNAEFSLRGLFHHFAFAEYPSTPVEMVVFAVLTGGRGEGVLELTVHALNDMDEYDTATGWVYRQQKWGRFIDDPAQSITLEIRIKKLVFLKPGEYVFVLKFDRTAIAERRISFITERGKA